MQRKNIVLFSMFLCLINLLIPTKSRCQIPEQEAISLEQPTLLSTDLLPIEDTMSLNVNSTQDPLSAFDEQNATSKNENLSPKARRKLLKQEAKATEQKALLQPDASLDFEVENKTGKTLYVTCFAYMKKRPFSRWRWDKSEIYKIEDNAITTIAMHPIEDEQDRINTFGYLALFDNNKDAEEAIYELLPDSNKIELDLLIHLKGKKVVLEIEKYGMVGEFFDYDFVRKDQNGTKYTPEVDFVVENNTGKTIHVTCFTFQKKAKGTWLAEKTKAAWTALDESRDDMSVWRFDKTPLITLKPGESGVIDVDTIVEQRDRKDVTGFLGIFDEDERTQAEQSVFELLEQQNKLSLGRLVSLKGKKVIIEVEKYGTIGNLIDFTTKPVSRIEFDKLNRPK